MNGGAVDPFSGMPFAVAAAATTASKSFPPIMSPIAAINRFAEGVWKAWFNQLGHWLAAATIADTHANRANYTAPTGPPGLYYETDRAVFYTSKIAQGTGGAPATATWIYASGEMQNTFANRPTDLGTNDAGFQFFATDTRTPYTWNGTAWLTGYPPTMQLGPGGALGIGGAAAPAYPLDIRGPASSQIHIASSDVDDGTWILNYASGGHQGAWVSSGAYYNGTAWVAKNTQAQILSLESGAVFRLYYNTGLTVGATFTPTQRFQVDLTTGVITPAPGGSQVGAWQTLTLQSGWTAQAGYSALYRLETNSNVVRFKAGIVPGTTADGTLLFTLPAGYIPTQAMVIPVSAYTGVPVISTAHLLIGADGTTKIYSFGSNAYLHLDGVSFAVT